MRLLRQLCAGAVVCASTALAALSTYSATSDIKYSVGISSAARSAGSGSIYIQVSYGPSYSWVGIGTGRQMSGSSIFMVYTDGTGNVTVSARDGKDHSEPSYNSAARVTLLDGSKADAQGVVANFRYEIAVGELSLESTSAPWIAGWTKGSALNTTNLKTTLQQHDDYRSFSLDIKTADVGNSTNPFLGAAPPANSTGGSPLVGVGDNGGVVVGQTQSTIDSYRKAHGALMGVAWVVLLPLGAIIMRLGFAGWWVHATVQGLGLAAIIAGFGVGYELSEATDLLYNNTHSTFGTVIFALVLVQPILGLVHHFQYQVQQQSTFAGLVHKWYGRVLIILAVVNGGLGLKLAGDTSGGPTIAYSVVSAVVFVVYIGVVALTVLRNKKGEKY